MKRSICRLAILFLMIYTFSTGANAASVLIPGGQIIGLELQDVRSRKERKEGRVQIRFKWGFNLDAEDRERISKEREKQNNDLEKFEKNYNKSKKD